MRWLQRVGMACALLGLVTAGSRPADAGPRDRRIRALERELARLESKVQRAMEFRARYLNLRADVYFLERLNRQDERLLERLIAYLKTPASIYDVFLSREANSYEAANAQRNQYGPGRVTLWVRCRFGLGHVRRQSRYSVTVEVLDPVRGTRLYQRLGPWQRRVSKMITNLSLPLTGLRLAPAKYQLRIRIRIGGTVVEKRIPYLHGRHTRGPQPLPPPPSGGGDVHTLGNF